jgi:phasin family protein
MATSKTTKNGATAAADTMVAATKDQVEKASKAAFKTYDDLNALNKDNLDAVMTSGTIVAKGYEAIGREVMAFAQSAMEANVAATKAMFGAKDPKEAFDLQAEYARNSMDKALAESAKLSEMSMSLAKEAFEPIQTRMNVTVESVMKPLGA